MTVILMVKTMAENSKIETCDHTHNAWMGCTKVSPGCKFCYAEELMETRYKKVKWGPQGTRIHTSKAYWRKPVQWNKETWRECVACGFRGKVGLDEPYYLCRCGSRQTKPTRQRVFCGSLMDVFEDNPRVADWRSELLDLITATSNLDWLLLTKRPENIMAFSHYALPDNVWIGTSIENRDTTERIGHLLAAPAKIHFLSVEPMLEPIELFEPQRLDWVICGGESGPHARPMEVAWAQDLYEQCKAAGVPFFMKQDSGTYPGRQGRIPDELWKVKEFPNA